MDNVKSKLPPMSGTLAERQSALNEKNAVRRKMEELLAPTPTGKEPEVVKIAKTITWGAVLVLVLIEIFVSIKVGGGPFSFGDGKATVDATVAVTETPKSFPSLTELQNLQYEGEKWLYFSFPSLMKNEY